MIATAFLTLLERKVLAGAQRRKGPNKIRLLGVLQPIADALKLLSKQFINPYRSNSFIFKIFPCLGMVISLVL